VVSVMAAYQPVMLNIVMLALPGQVASLLYYDTCLVVWIHLWENQQRNYHMLKDAFTNIFV
jgi:hypothetical protein